MKKTIALLIFTLSTVLSYSQSNSIITWKFQADTLYKHEKYTEAFALYDTILKSINKSANQLIITSNTWFKHGYCLRKQERYDAALASYAKAMSYPLQTRKDTSFYCKVLSYSAYVLRKQNKINSALTYYDKAIELFHITKNTAGEARVLRVKGSYLRRKSRYEEAKIDLEKSLELYQNINNKRGEAQALNNLGNVYSDWGRYDLSVSCYEKSLAIKEELGGEGIASTLNNLGIVYRSWGKYADAISYYEKSLAVHEIIGTQNSIGVARVFNNLGLVYWKSGRNNLAISYYEKSLVVKEKLGAENGIAMTLNNIGIIYMEWSKNDLAISYYKKSLAITEKTDDHSITAMNFNNLGIVYMNWGKYNEAVSYYKKSLTITRKIGDVSLESKTLGAMGNVYELSNNLDSAIYYYQKSIALKEQLRATAPGEVKKDYLASQVGVYKKLVRTTIKKQDNELALHASEQVHGRYLKEQLRGTGMRGDVDAGMRGGRTIIYTLVDSNLAIIDVDSGNVSSQLVNLNPLLDSAWRFIEDTVRPTFSQTIKHYRTLLCNPRKTEEMMELGALIYGYLIKPINNQSSIINNQFTIIPDGILGYLPFETLIDNNGKYLVETIDIKYAQSMGVLEMIAHRTSASTNHVPRILALGGAIYDEEYYDDDMEKGMSNNMILDLLEEQGSVMYNDSLRGADLNENMIKYLRKKMEFANEEGTSLAPVYNSLVREWANLPGTMAEVEAIKQLMPEATVLSGKEVSEHKIKELSESGELKKYDILHFSTHGIAIPEIPELSAVVLSQFTDTAEQKGQDGYLTVEELLQLDINADFVCLSACETGLGKIQSGEGVVGLSQALLVAGANGICVSLWQVADNSTTRFMVEMYKKTTYNQSILEVKREFISGKYGEQWKHPYYWAPFVYFGK